MTKRNLNSLKRRIKKYNSKGSLELWIKIYNINSKLEPTFHSKIKMAEKYLSKEINPDKYIEIFKKYIKYYNDKNKRGKITYEYFKIFGLTEKEYKIYVKNKTRKFDYSNQDHNSLKYFISKYGKEEGTKKYKENCLKRRQASKRCLEYWIKKGFTEDEARLKIKEVQATFSRQKCFEKYGPVKGYIIFKNRQKNWQKTLNSKPKEEIEKINKSKNIFARKKNETEFQYKNRIKKICKKIKKSRIRKGLILPDSEQPLFHIYKREVWRITNKNDLTQLPNYEKRGKLDKNKNAYHLDHRYSITEGFKNNIPPYIIGSIHNLEFKPATKNISKSVKCDISLDELINRFFS